MPTPDSTLSTLSSIRTKVRRLTRSPSTSQLTDAQIDDYVNTFVLYDFPEFTLDKKFTFFLMPNIDVYENNTVNQNDPFYNFKNKYKSVQRPIYVGGQAIAFTQSREQFFNQYPKWNYSETVATGDGSTLAFSGTISTIPLLADYVMFSTVDSSNNGIVLKDIPRKSLSTGYVTSIGDLVIPDTTVSLGTINYLTGVYSFTLSTAPGSGAEIIAQTYAYTTSMPLVALFEDNKFTFRPVPDKSYKVEIDAFQRPTELLNSTDTPDLAQWWQYISYGASKKVFEDRMDIESVQAIMTEFMNQRSLVLQRLVIQQSTERSATIYTDMGAEFNIGKTNF